MNLGASSSDLDPAERRPREADAYRVCQSKESHELLIRRSPNKTAARRMSPANEVFRFSLSTRERRLQDIQDYQNLCPEHEDD